MTSPDTQFDSSPKGKLEETLAAAWIQVLGIEHVARNDNFFSSGGHSLRGIRLVKVLRDWGYALDIEDIFSYPVFQDQAGKLVHSVPAAMFAPPRGIPDGCVALEPAMMTLTAFYEKEIAIIELAVPGGAPNIQDVYPLGPLQENILLDHILARSGDTAVRSDLFTLTSRERLDAFLDAWRVLMQRHDALRSAVLWEGLPRPVQIVWRTAELPIDEVDFGHSDPVASLRAFMTPENSRMDLRRAPLIRVRVAADHASDKWHALVDIHRLALDPLSHTLLADELLACLSGKEERVLERLPPAVPFRDFIARTFIQAGDESGIAFFQERLARLEHPTLPYGLTRAPADAISLDEAREDIPPELAHRITSLAKARSVSAAALFHLAWALVVARTSARNDVVFGTTFGGRTQQWTAIDGAVGQYSNILPLRLDLKSDSIETLLKKTQAELAATLAFEQTPLAQARHAAGITGLSPLFSAVIDYRHYDHRLIDERFAEFGVTTTASQESTSWPFKLTVIEHRKQFSFIIQIDSRMAASRQKRYLLTALERLVEALENTPQRLISTIGLVTEAEQAALVQGFNNTIGDCPGSLIHELIEDETIRDPGAPALLTDRVCLSYSQINLRANKLAHYLRVRGVVADQPVAVFMDHGPDLVVAMLGILKAGGACLILDTNEPDGWLAGVLKSAAPRVVLTETHHRSRVPAHGAKLVVIDPEWALIDKSEDSELTREETKLDNRNLAAVVYNRDAFGRPTGTLIEHRSLVNLLLSAPFALTRDDTLAQCDNPGSDSALLQIWGALVNGAGLALMPGIDSLSPAQFQNQIANMEISVLMLDAKLVKRFADSFAHTPDRLRLLLSRGESDPIAVRKILAATANRPLQIFHGFGMPETGGFATLCPIRSVPARATDLPIGKPIVNTQVYILDDNAHPVPVNVVGEIVVGGFSVARGYRKRSRLSGERFVPNPFARDENARMFFTRKPGRWRANGFIEYLGTAEQARMELVRIVPEDKTQAIIIEDLEEPETQLASASQPDNAANAPQGEVEEALLPLWRDLLKRQHIEREDNFFVLGGHSLAAMRLVARIEQSFGTRLTLRDIFEHPKFSDFAAFITTQIDTVTLSGELVSLRDKGTRRPLFMVHVPSGNALPYAPLVQLLPEDIPVFGLQADWSDPPGSIEEIAARYVRTIQQKQPHGPYRLAGWSAGGLIAYEIATQLLGQDEAVEFIGLINTAHPASGIETIKTSDAVDAAFLLTLVRALNPALGEDSALELTSMGNFEALLERCRILSLLPSGLGFDSPEKRLTTHRLIRRLAQSYCPGPLPVPVHLFVAEHGMSARTTKDGAALGWTATLGTALQLKLVSGIGIRILETPHVQVLAVRMATVLNDLETSGPPSVPAYSPIFAIHQDKACRTPIFCLPGAGANVSCFLSLIMAIKQPSLIYGLQPRGFDAPHVPHSSVVTAASVCADAILKTAPQGPYRVLGHSFGGWVALETVRQLRARGAWVDTVAILDSCAPLTQDEPAKFHDRIEAIERLINLFAQVAGKSLGFDPEALRSKTESQQLAYVHQLMVKAGLIPRASKPEAIRGMLRTFHTNINTPYRPPTQYDGEVLLVRAAAEKGDDGMWFEHWRVHAPRASVLEIQANHMNLLNPPAIETVAARLTELWKLA